MEKNEVNKSIEFLRGLERCVIGVDSTPSRGVSFYTSMSYEPLESSITLQKMTS